MPAWLQPVAANQPITPIVETIRGLLTDATVGASALWAVGWCLAILAVSMCWGAWLFGRRAARR
ncbi:ABC transporter permease [Microbacterium sp.]|uniref:ABC transporter permease n=1 Tax=Microbacterium sp. TaxID=51671 RepID=UPI00289BB056|nr:ABC transporter permease [Microbacterium sp.]